MPPTMPPAWTAEDAAARLARALGAVTTKAALLATLAQHLDAAFRAGVAHQTSRAFPPARQ